MTDRVVEGTERHLITRAALDYFEGWFDTDVARVDRALHRKLAKRSHKLGQATKEQMLAWTAAGEGRSEDPGPDRRIDVEVVEVHGEIATAIVCSDVYREYLHLVRTGEGWKIANPLWQPA